MPQTYRSNLVCFHTSWLNIPVVSTSQVGICSSENSLTSERGCDFTQRHNIMTCQAMERKNTVDRTMVILPGSRVFAYRWCFSGNSWFSLFSDFLFSSLISGCSSFQVLETPLWRLLTLSRGLLMGDHLFWSVKHTGPNLVKLSDPGMILNGWVAIRTVPLLRDEHGIGLCWIEALHGFSPPLFLYFALSFLASMLLKHGKKKIGATLSPPCQILSSRAPTFELNLRFMPSISLWNALGHISPISTSIFVGHEVGEISNSLEAALAKEIPVQNVLHRYPGSLWQVTQWLELWACCPPSLKKWS